MYFTMIKEFKFLKTEKGIVPFALTKSYTLKEAPALIEYEWTIFSYVDFFCIEFTEKEYLKMFDSYGPADRVVNQSGIYYDKEQLMADIRTAIDNASSLGEMELKGFYPVFFKKLIKSEEMLRLVIEKCDLRGFSLQSAG